jgi:predicted AAA+ superfamily ATPase
MNLEIRKLNISGNEVIVDREKYIKLIEEYKDKRTIKIITGMRRTGKTEILKHYILNLIETGVEENHIIYIPLDVVEDFNFNSYLELLNYILSKVIDEKKYYLLIDEIQNIDD